MGLSVVTYALAKKYVNKRIAETTILKIKVVSALPQVGELNVLYFTKKDGTGGEPENQYAEYIWLESEQRWEELGIVKVDLSNYYNKQETVQIIEQYIKDNPPSLGGKLVIGQYVYDGTTDVTIPTYDGDISNSYGGAYNVN